MMLRHAMVILLLLSYRATGASMWSGIEKGIEANREYELRRRELEIQQQQANEAERARQQAQQRQEQEARRREASDPDLAREWRIGLTTTIIGWPLCTFSDPRTRLTGVCFLDTSGNMIEGKSSLLPSDVAARLAQLALPNKDATDIAAMVREIDNTLPLLQRDLATTKDNIAAASTVNHRVTTATANLTGTGSLRGTGANVHETSYQTTINAPSLDSELLAQQLQQKLDHLSAKRKALIVLAQRYNIPLQDRDKQTDNPRAVPPQPATTADKLRELETMKTQGLITADEYTSLRRKLLQQLTQ